LLAREKKFKNAFPVELPSAPNVFQFLEAFYLVSKESIDLIAVENPAW